ncbi:hypothetical protein [Parapedobacter sp. 2B3]|uniref:hypothetical protein n=1 Tax=Parapedobacter sp. 2B3 TaxID=3342381 RepID=UPI0035B610C8
MMISGKRNSLSVSLLYFVYFAFLLAALLTTRSSLAPVYFSNIVSVGAIIVYVFVCSRKLGQKIDLPLLLVVIVAFFTIFFSVFLGSEIYTALLYLKIISLVGFFCVVRVDKEQFVKFLNVTYLVYALLSLFIFYNIIPIAHYSRWDHYSMYVNLGQVKYAIVYGLEGSVAYLDSYSGFILLVNIFLNKGKNRRVYIFLSCLFILLTFKMTPIIGLLISLLTYYVIRNRYSAISFLLVANFFFIVLLYLLIKDIDPFDSVLSFKDYAYIVTHARTMIWEQQIPTMLKSYNISDYIFGGYNSKLFSVAGTQLWGSDTGTFYDNPHNTYLLLFFRSAFLFVLFYSTLLIAVFKNFNRKHSVIILFIMLVCYSNSSIISLQNPVYIISLTYLLINYKENENTLHPSRI